jgi:dihydrofolate reductase
LYYPKHGTASKPVARRRRPLKRDPLGGFVMTKCSVFVATSLDGFIAREDGSIDWLNEANEEVPAGEDCGFGAFIATVDTLVMGRITFEQVLTFGAWPYGPMPVIVLSHSAVKLRPDMPPTVSTSRESPSELVARLSAEGKKHLYVDGGATVQSFLEHDLIDEITITAIPILLGAGKPLFGRMSDDVILNHVRTQTYEFGFVRSTYSISRDAGAA